jgi:nucleotidyltransferase substrate binding protein (TIGR01987 family)
MKKFESLLEDFGRILTKLEEVLKLEKTEINRDSAIQRFEISVDLARKALKAYLEVYKGIICRSPKGCLREAFSQGIINYDDYWIKIVDFRNQTAHLYSEKLADKIYDELPKVLEYLKTLYNSLKSGDFQKEI